MCTRHEDLSLGTRMCGDRAKQPEFSQGYICVTWWAPELLLCFFCVQGGEMTEHKP